MEYSKKQERDMVVYVLMRTDLPSMNAGKAIAQCHHAGVHMATMYSGTRDVNDYLEATSDGQLLHFNTTLVLGATETQILDVFEKMHEESLKHGKTYVSSSIIDPSYPFFVEKEIARIIPPNVATLVKEVSDSKVLMTRKEFTCAYFLGDRNDEDFKNLFSELSLHP